MAVILAPARRQVNAGGQNEYTDVFTIMPPATCIYCRTTKKARFPREHVIPEAFGKFKNNFTLRSVCGECNTYFGKELELFLGRDSGEALLRLRYGLKPMAEARELRNTRTELTVNVPGPWLGARILLRPNDACTKLNSEFLPQVAFRKKPDGGWVWFSEEQLSDPALVDPYRKNVEIKIIGPSDDALQRLRHKLADLGIDFKQQGVLDQPVTNTGTIEVELLYRIDQAIFRGIAKIAFNYVAYIRGEEFVLRADFDAIRNYIRYCQHPGWLPAIASDMPILADDTKTERQTNGHLLVFDWNRGAEGVIAYISLFNSITYHVLLCRKYSGLWHILRSGHHFDIETRTISPVFGVKCG